MRVSHTWQQKIHGNRAGDFFFRRRKRKQQTTRDKIVAKERQESAADTETLKKANTFLFVPFDSGETRMDHIWQSILVTFSNLVPIDTHRCNISQHIKHRFTADTWFLSVFLWWHVSAGMHSHGLFADRSWPSLHIGTSLLISLPTTEVISSSCWISARSKDNVNANTY